jgi:hypothetical protein
MRIFEGLFRRSASADGNVQPPQKVDTTVIICDYPKFLVAIDDEDLRHLVRDVLRSSDEVSAGTVIRYLAGDVGGDVERRFGTPTRRFLVVSGTEAVTFSFNYPQPAKPFQFQQAICALVAERWAYWIADYSAKLKK